MPITQIALDGSVQEEDVVLLVGKQIIMKLIESKNTNSLLSNSEVKRFLEIKDLWKTSIFESKRKISQGLLRYWRPRDTAPFPIIKRIL